jgi:hypothetical protein
LIKIKLVILFLGLFLLPITVLAQNPADYLILQNVNNFTNDGKGECGNGSGIIGSADHFDLDHIVTTCETDYYNFKLKMAVEIQVEQHTGGDSDRWLLHELDAEFRTYYGIPGKSYGPEKIEGQTILVDSAGGNDYLWLSGNKIIKIEYSDLQMTKAEPLEVVKTYLVKHPSTITPFTLQELRNNSNVTKWIKDEIDRRLWLCDKWNAQFQTGKVTQADLIYNLVRSMGVFLNYRQKYYGISAKSDLEALFSYKQNKDVASIQKKLTEYKTWWAKHKDRSISLP